MSGRSARSFGSAAAVLCAFGSAFLSSILLWSKEARAADSTSLACIHYAEDGQGARDSGKLLRARELFASCAARECPSTVRRDCTNWLEDAKRQTPSVVIVARDGSGRDLVDAKASVDGVLRQPRLDGSVLELDPGEHVVRVQMGNQTPVDLRVVFGSGEKNRTIVVTMTVAPEPVKPPPPPPPPPVQVSHGLPAATYFFGGLGIVALGSFGYFGLRGKSDADHLRATCVPGCAPSDVSAVHTKLLIADVSLGVGVVSLITATVFALHRSAPSSPSAAWDFRAGPSEGGARGELLLRF